MPNPLKVIRSEPSTVAADEKDRTDGLKLLLPDGWIHVRASNTEPLLRVAAEAKSDARAEKLYRGVLELFGE